MWLGDWIGWKWRASDANRRGHVNTLEISRRQGHTNSLRVCVALDLMNDTGDAWSPGILSPSWASEGLQNCCHSQVRTQAPSLATGTTAPRAWSKFLPLISSPRFGILVGTDVTAWAVGKHRSTPHVKAAGGMTSSFMCRAETNTTTG